MKTIRILSIDGGGIRGILPAVLLTALERRTGARVYEMFDLVAGTSTGAILAAALLKPRPLTAQQVLEFYLREGANIFPQSALRYITSAAVGPKYDERPLESKLLEVFGDQWLSEAIKPLLIPAYELTTRQASFFKSWKAQGEDIGAAEMPGLFDFRLRDAVRASSAAQTYLRPAKIRSRAGVEGVYIDGANVANNPSMCAIASARRMNPDLTRIVLVSLGTGQQADPITYAESSSWGLLNWARPAFDCLMDGAADVVTYQVEEAFGHDVTQYRIDFTGAGRSASGPIDDASAESIRRLVLAGESEVKRCDSVLSDLTRILTTVPVG